jgi:hypothetical protein
VARFKGYLLVACATLIVASIVNPVQSGKAVARTVQRVFTADAPTTSSADASIQQAATTTARLFQTQVEVPLQFSGAQIVTGTATIVVPTGYRLVIQYVTVGPLMEPNGIAEGLQIPVQITTMVNGSEASFYATAQSSSVSGLPLPVTTSLNTAIQWYADGGTDIVISAMGYNNQAGQGNVLVSIRGYLVPMS